MALPPLPFYADVSACLLGGGGILYVARSARPANKTPELESETLMQISVPPIILVAVCLGAVAIGLGIVALIQSLVAARFQPAQKLSQVWTLAAALPSVVMVIMFYSLAIHVRLSLGQWPQSIGDVGFPSGLIMHERIAGNYVFGPLLVSLFIWPLAVFLCWWVSSWRRFIAYQTIHALSFLVGFGAICLAPSSFLNWWWD